LGGNNSQRRGGSVARIGQPELGDGFVAVPVSGTLDLHAVGGLREQLDDLIDRFPQSDLILDLSQVDFVDSSGLGLLLGRFRRLQGLGRTLKLIGVRVAVEKVLRLSGFHGIMGVETLPRVSRPGAGA
jgi:stage II sporulation protein AA (anti-sigma F factor antagonist)